MPQRNSSPPSGAEKKERQGGRHGHGDQKKPKVRAEAVTRWLRSRLVGTQSFQGDHDALLQTQKPLLEKRKGPEKYFRHGLRLLRCLRRLLGLQGFVSFSFSRSLLHLYPHGTSLQGVISRRTLWRTGLSRQRRTIELVVIEKRVHLTRLALSVQSSFVIVSPALLQRSHDQRTDERQKPADASFP